jgi:eukaryotic translation initiation factor 2C
LAQAYGQINKDLIKVSARVLDPPRVLYGGGYDARPENGNWRLNKQRVSCRRLMDLSTPADNQFFRSERPLKAWAFISFDKFCDQDNMRRYIHFLCGTLEVHGVPVENKRPECFGPIDPRNPSNIAGALQQAARSAYMSGGKCAPQLICIVLPGR